MSAAATAAGYLYASGRLRGRKEGEEPGKEERKRDEAPRAKRKEIKVAVYEPAQDMEPAASRPKTTPKIQYRTRRWKPE